MVVQVPLPQASQQVSYLPKEQSINQTLTFYFYFRTTNINHTLLR